MSLSNVTRRLRADELAREPRSLAVVAYFDGYGQASGARPMDHPRRMTTDEARSWREGFSEGQRERRCHAVHGFAPCDGEHTP